MIELKDYIEKLKKDLKESLEEDTRLSEPAN